MGGVLCRPITSTEVLGLLTVVPNDDSVFLSAQAYIMNPQELSSCPPVLPDTCVSNTLELLCLKESVGASKITLCQNALILLPYYSTLSSSFLDVTSIEEIICETEPCWIMRGARTGVDDYGEPLNMGDSQCPFFKQSIDGTPFSVSGISLLDVDLGNENSERIPPFYKAFEIYEFDLAKYDLGLFELNVLGVDTEAAFGGTDLFCFEGDVGTELADFSFGGQAVEEKSGKAPKRGKGGNKAGKKGRRKGSKSSRSQLAPTGKYVLGEIANLFATADTNEDGVLSLKEVEDSFSVTS